MALGGFAYALTVLWAYFVHETPFQGWTPLMILVLFLGGLIMFMLGILGEYIWHILDEVKGRPTYIIRDKFL